MVLPWDIVLKICSVHAGRNSSGHDKFVWVVCKDGMFSVKKAYQAQLLNSNVADWEGRFIWKLKLPPKIIYFLWLVFHGKLLTNLQRNIRGLSNVAVCPRCEEGIKDIQHLLCNCRFSAVVCRAVWRGCMETVSFNSCVKEWLISNLNHKCLDRNHMPSYLVFAHTLWLLWK
ncbi:hypothetical protein ACOSP7_013939 [Xanthoceras sorbifolium]